MNSRDHGIPIGVVIAEASPGARVDELIDAMTTPHREQRILGEQRAHERKVVGESGHGLLPALEFDGREWPHVTLVNIVAQIRDIERDQGVRFGGVIRDRAGLAVGIAFVDPRRGE
jgi:hypothetical protein